MQRFFSGVAFAVTAAFVAVPASAALAADPVKPEVNHNFATCAMPLNTLQLANWDTAVAGNYRVGYQAAGAHYIFSTKAETEVMLDGGGTFSWEGFFAGKGKAPIYGEEIEIGVFYFDREKAYDPSQYDAELQAQGKQRFIRLDTSKQTLVDPATVCQPAVAASKDVIAPGSDITFTASDFMPGEEVTFEIEVAAVKMVAGKAVADAQGVATLVWAVPADFAAGEHTVYAQNAAGALQVSSAFTVQQPAAPIAPATPAASTQPAAAGQQQLAKTGGADMTLGYAAAVALIAGGAGVVALRRKK